MEAIVNVPVLPLFKDADNSQIIEDEVLYGMSVNILKDEPTKSRVLISTSYHYEGYVLRKGLLGKKEHDQLKSEEELVYVSHPVVDILSQPKMQANLLLTLPLGCLLKKIEQADPSGWVKVQLMSGERGYVRESYIAPWMKNPSAEEEVLRQQLVETAIKYLGTQYRWGGKSTYGIDCSGLCSMVYLLNGITIFRDSQIKEGFPIHEIPLEKVRKGDLLYFKGHIAMWIGEKLIIHSTGKNGREGVVIDSLDEQMPGARTDLWDIYLKAGSFF